MCCNSGRPDKKATEMTKEQQEILDKYYGHWATLRDLQFMKNLDDAVIDDIQRVHDQILPPRLYTRWCGECVAELVRNTYRKYDEWKAQQPLTDQEVGHIEAKWNSEFKKAKKTNGASLRTFSRK